MYYYWPRILKNPQQQNQTTKKTPPSHLNRNIEIQVVKITCTFCAAAENRSTRPNLWTWQFFFTCLIVLTWAGAYLEDLDLLSLSICIQHHLEMVKENFWKRKQGSDFPCTALQHQLVRNTRELSSLKTGTHSVLFLIYSIANVISIHKTELFITGPYINGVLFIQFMRYPSSRITNLSVRVSESITANIVATLAWAFLTLC